ncbi:histidine kinase/DNA gyrase B/HSP90-like ATPase [Pseudomonas sp. URMO17WK12:I1]|uniref:HD domain-containing protein n=1 Tax=unclassified Pseudomonas TaxID=196821 RepID=UPI0004B988BC|nr:MULTISPECIES: ATP-binding protein [unclassified Pseudomonas]PZW63881.1 histidine kinase/DNA gyrase B/HSP90-like ATPase [Pseudomonas sp. URMO17WK12:I1]
MATFEQTNIWLRTMAEGGDPTVNQKVERLKSSYRSFWNNAILLSREIQRDVPNLTLHDEAHFDALWNRMDQIAGPDLVITPMELFVLGGAILLHDNANSLAAFEGGLEELRITPEWKDAAAEWVERSGNSTSAESLPPEALSAILFEVLRSLHAERAMTLAGLSISSNGRVFHLIEDDLLRTHAGDIMGQIAASHHWDITALSNRLPPICGALGDMPTTWTIRPVLLGCLLRCADATQLDQKRAPDFLYAMLRLHGVSEHHWRAQNRLAAPVVSPHDSTALIFNSTIPFAPQDSDAWWIAHDAIQVANRELQASNALLRDLRLPSFAISRIEGALSPSALARFVAVKGWRPVQAEVKITEVQKVVEMFGGEQLYGHDSSVALRELIQNAADAIRFRRELEPSSAGYQGQIIVRLRPCEDDTSAFWLDVEDDGLGMSEAVLTGPLIDFGSSYVSSALVKSERPGLLSKGKKRIGKFGIGFFSSFMISDEIKVTSRPFDAGREALRTLHFQNGLGHRPLLLEDQPSELSIMTSTRVRLRMTCESHANLLAFPSQFNNQKMPITLPELVGALCPILDMNVFVEVDGKLSLTHSRDWMQEDRLEWLRRVTVSRIHSHEDIDNHLAESAKFLTYIDEADPSAGLACISGQGGSGVSSVGTLRASSIYNAFSDDFVGVIDFEPEDPRRGRGKAKANGKLPAWASDQARLHQSKGTKPDRLIKIAQHVADFKGDASPVAVVRFNHTLVGIDVILKSLINSEVIYAPLKYRGTSNKEVVITRVRERHSGYIDSYRPGELELLVPTIESGSEDNSNFYTVPYNESPAEFGVFNIISRVAARSGFLIKAEIIERIEFARYIGEASARDGLVPGKIIACSGMKLWAEQIVR